MTQIFQILGLKRILIIGVLAVINGLLGAGIWLYLIPRNQELFNQLDLLSSQVATKRADTSRLQKEFQTIQQQKAYFENLRSAGFLSNQNRAVARVRIDNIQKFTYVLSAKYDITAAAIENSPPAKDAGYVILNSPMKVEVDAMDDIDVYNFIYWIENAFPGQVSTKSVTLSRATDINEATLRALGSGYPVTLIRSTMEFEWRTMVPASEVGGIAPPKTR